MTGDFEIPVIYYLNISLESLKLISPFKSRTRTSYYCVTHAISLLIISRKRSWKSLEYLIVSIKLGGLESLLSWSQRRWECNKKLRLVNKTIMAARRMSSLLSPSNVSSLASAFLRSSRMYSEHPCFLLLCIIDKSIQMIAIHVQR